MTYPPTLDVFQKQLEELFLAGQSCAEPRPDAQSEWIPELLKRKGVHDDDYLVFGHFKDFTETILDVGANYGYSAASIWAAGSKAHVFSIEPIAAFEPCLKSIKRIRSPMYDYWIGALGDTAGTLILWTPVINGRMVGALTSGISRPHFESLAKHLLKHAADHTPEGKINHVDFFWFSCPVYPLDGLPMYNPAIDTAKIVAAKIDAEGLEFSILRGMTNTINRFTPLLLIECGWSDQIRIFCRLLDISRGDVLKISLWKEQARKSQ